jgi:ribonuclease R
MISGKMSDGRLQKLNGIVEEVSKQSSEQERLAEKAERDTDDLKITEYMSQFIGDEFEGIVSSITSFGIYVEILNLAEGLLHVRNLTDDYYYYDEKTLSMVGERTKKRFSIGDYVVVRIDSTDIDNREINFSLVRKIEEEKEQ